VIATVPPLRATRFSPQCALHVGHEEDTEHADDKAGHSTDYSNTPLQEGRDAEGLIVLEELVFPDVEMKHVLREAELPEVV
jgi:hypothetical protein